MTSLEEQAMQKMEDLGNKVLKTADDIHGQLKFLVKYVALLKERQDEIIQELEALGQYEGDIYINPKYKEFEELSKNWKERFCND